MSEGSVPNVTKFGDDIRQLLNLNAVFRFETSCSVSKHGDSKVSRVENGGCIIRGGVGRCFCTLECFKTFLNVFRQVLFYQTKHPIDVDTFHTRIFSLKANYTTSETQAACVRVSS